MVHVTPQHHSHVTWLYVAVTRDAENDLVKTLHGRKDTPVQRKQTMQHHFRELALRNGGGGDEGWRDVGENPVDFPADLKRIGHACETTLTLVPGRNKQGSLKMSKAWLHFAGCCLQIEGLYDVLEGREYTSVAETYNTLVIQQNRLNKQFRRGTLLIFN